MKCEQKYTIWNSTDIKVLNKLCLVAACFGSGT